MNLNEKTPLPLTTKIQLLLAIVATLVTIALAAYIPTLVQKKTELDSEIAQLNAQRVQLQSQITDLEKQKTDAEKLGSAVASAFYAANPRQAQKSLEESLSASPDAGVRPRIFIHIRSAAPRAAAKPVADAFRQSGYVVPGIQILVESGPAKPKCGTSTLRMRPKHKKFLTS